MIYLHTAYPWPSLQARYAFAIEYLAARGITAQLAYPWPANAPTDVVVSHSTIEVPGALTWGGPGWTRRQSLEALATLGVSCAEWSDNADVVSAWGRAIVKQDGTDGSADVRVVSTRAPALEPNEIVCREVNPDDGTVYRAELFAGELMLAYTLDKQPLRDRIKTVAADGTCSMAPYRPAGADRSLYRSAWTPTAAELAGLKRISAQLTSLHHVGYVALESMRAPGGELVAIELNDHDVATYWPQTFPDVNTRFASALHALVTG